MATNLNQIGLLSTKNVANPGLNISEVEGDGGTEFTEQYDLEDNKIDLECSAQRLINETSVMQEDEETVFGENEEER